MVVLAIIITYNIFIIVSGKETYKHGLFSKDPTRKLKFFPPTSIYNDTLLLTNEAKKLLIGQEAKLVPSQVTKERRRFKRSGIAYKIKESTWNKHFYSGGNDPEYMGMSAQDIRADLSERNSNYQFEKFTSNSLTIVEVEEVLKDDLVFKKPGNTKNTNIYQSETSYPVTQLTFEHGFDSNGKPTVEVWGQEGHVRVQFAVDEMKGMIVHVHGISGGDIPVLGKKVKLTTYAGEDVDMFPDAASAKRKRPGNYEADTEQDNKNPKLDRDDNRGEGSSKTRECNTPGGLRRKRALGCGCAICVKPNGDVDSVDSKQFVEEYKKANAKGQEEMTEKVKEKMNGEVPDLSGQDSLENKKAKKLIELEQVKAHARTVGVASDVQKLKGKSEQGIDTVSDRLLSVKNNVRLKLSNSKVAQKINSLANSNKAKAFGKGVGAVSKPLGRFFLGKSIIQAISNGDTESLIIVGALLGFEGGVWAGGKILNHVGKAKLAMKLGKYAGPVGAVIDIGMSVYSIVKAVNRLNNATNQYKKNDAIADIVSDSVDIATTATVVTLSLAFPPAAPFIVAAGIVVSLVNKLVLSAYQAQNEVNRINSEIKMLDFEKEGVYLNHFTGFGITGNYDYLDHLIKEKQANDLIAGEKVDFLKNNDEFLGVVFPSRTLIYEGGCNLKRKKCEEEGPFFDFKWHCWSWSSWETVGEKCFRHMPCSGCHGNCEDRIDRGKRDEVSFRFCDPHEMFWDILIGIPSADVHSRIMSSYLWNEYECQCEEANTTRFGEPKSNSLVDFRKRQNVYWERAVPIDVEGANFICKPGSLTNLGFKISGELENGEYLCENAIAIRQPKEREKRGQILLIDLENGNDTVYFNPSDSTPTLFRVGESGTKEFRAGYGSTEFLLDGNCVSSLNGKLFGGSSEEDVLNIHNSCAQGQTLFANFKNRTLQSMDSKMDIQINSIEKFYGRTGESDQVTASCNLRLIMGRGGKNEFRKDHILIPEGIGAMCSVNLTVIAAQYTYIQSHLKRGNLTLIVESSLHQIDINLKVFPENLLRLELIFFAPMSQRAVFESKNRLKVGGTNLYLIFQSERTLPIYFKEDTPGSSQYSTLVVSPSNPPIFYHTLPDLRKYGYNQQYERLGNPKIENTFEISGANWHVVGGEQNDEFVVSTSQISKLRLEGGEGDDTLRLQEQLRGILVDLRNFNSIENVHGVPGVPINVVCACDTKLVMGMGGSNSTSDLIAIPESCSSRELQVVAKGNSKVKVGKMGEREQVTVFAIGSSANENNRLRFEMESQSENSSGLTLVIQLSQRISTFGPGTTSRDGKSALIRLEGSRGELVKLVLDVDPSNNEQFLSNPQIQLLQIGSDEPPSQLLIERETLNVKALWHLNTPQHTSTVSGYTQIPNLFQVSNGSWQITGGDANDTFTISGPAQSATTSVNGGGGSENALILEESNNNGTYLVNLEKEEMGFLHATQKGKVRNISHILGRPEQPDSIHVGCTTNYVNGRGGARKGQEDLIFISENGCNNNLTETEIFMREFTKVKNMRKYGAFSYQIPSLLTIDLQLNALDTNRHTLNFGHIAWEQIQAIGFNKNESTLGLKVKAAGENAEKVHIFNMYRETGSEQYSNPIFEFQAQPGAPVKGDLHVGKDGATVATILIYGKGLQNDGKVPLLPAQLIRFVVKITEENENGVTRESSNETEGILGRSIVGSKSVIANQFWILELNTPLLILDGGDCVNCTNFLHLGETLETGKSIEMSLDHDTLSSGNLTSGGKTLIAQLGNIHEVSGRKGGNDTITLSSCNVKQVSGMENIIINRSARNNCSFNLTIEIGEQTPVSLEEMAPYGISSEMWDKSSFQYYFTTLRSFDPSGDAWLGPSHNYYLSFSVNELDSISFHMEKEAVYYKIGGKEYYHAMLAGLDTDEQFYSQPQILMKDGYKISIGRDGNILLVKGTKSSFTPHDIRSEIIPELESAAAKLGVTIMLQANSQLFYVGHRNVDFYGNAVEDRNVLESSGDLESHLVGGGVLDTFYEITSLQDDVFIYTGFETEVDLPQEILDKSPKQTIDLTDIVVPIRKNSGTKYVPKVEVVGVDLVIKMHGFLDEHPGEIWIVNGTMTQVAQRLQLLLNNAMMDFVPVQMPLVKQGTKENVEWEIQPHAILIPEGMVYTISSDDLEDNHQFRVVTKSNATFQPVKNGADLYLTNIATESNEELAETTTVIISDYFEESTASNSEDKVGTLVETVKGVTISVPGLSLLLNDSKVVVMSTSVDLQEGECETNQEEEVVDLGLLREWKSVLHESEEILLADLPDIPRVFAVPTTPIHILVLVGAGLFLLTFSGLLTAIFLFVKLKSRRKCEYSVVNTQDMSQTQVETVELKEMSKSDTLPKTV